MTTFTQCENGRLIERNADEVFDSIRVKEARAKLINEEHRLVLMKKIRQSQTRPIAAAAAANASTNSNQTISSASASSASAPTLNGSQQLSMASNLINNTALLSGQPSSKKMRSAMAALNAPGSSSSPSSSSLSSLHHKNLNPAGLASNNLLSNNNLASHNLSSNANTLLNSSAQSINQTPAHAHQRTKTNNLWNPPPQPAKHPTPVGIAPPHVGNLSRQPITTPPNVVEALMSSMGTNPSTVMAQLQASMAAANRRAANAAAAAALPQQLQQHQLQQQQKRNQQQLSLKQQHQQQQQSLFNKSQAAQMLLQKRNAAKSAIQKTVEQTLMQLPPKHIQLGIDFVPNANNIEFVYYIGLETCVDYLTDAKNPLDPKPLEKPFECSTCGTDFTPSWSWKRSLPVCENCVSNHVKKSIKNQQTNRIKSVLAKAAKQEQEMDQRIMTEAANVVSTPSPTSSTNQHSLLNPSVSQPQQQRSSPQVWPRVSSGSLLNIGSSSGGNHRSVPSSSQSLASSSASTTTTSSAAAAAAAVAAAAANLQPNFGSNPLTMSQTAALAPLLQRNPQLSALASLMVANSNTAQQQQQPTPPRQQPQQQRSSQQSWPRVSSGSLLSVNTSGGRRSGSSQNSGATTTTTSSANQTTLPNLNSNPLAALQPAALASLLQMNPQLSTLASLMTANTNSLQQQQPPHPPVPQRQQQHQTAAPSAGGTNNTNQLAQVAALLMNMWKQR